MTSVRTDPALARMGWARAGLGLGVGFFAWRDVATNPPSGVVAGVALLVVVAWLASIVAHVRAPMDGWQRDARGAIAVFSADLALIALLIHLHGSVQSPFAALLGLVVVASGLRGQVLPPLVLSVMACVFYLAAVELALPDGMSPAQSLHALLQVSALLLAGGAMGAIARRYERLARAGDQAMRRHRSLRELHDAIMQTMNEGLVVLDEDFRVIEANPSARAMLGDAAAGASLPAPLAGLKRRGEESEEVHLGGRHLLASVRALRGDDMDEAAWLLTLVDITRLRLLEARLIERERMAALGEMSAMLAHEIRNPVQTMAQGLELLKLGDAASAADIRAILHEEMLRLNRLVNMMLDYSKPLEPAPRLIRPRELIEAAVRQADLAGDRGIEWRCAVNEARLDPDHFRLALDNLLHNALVNRRGDAPVRVTMEGREGGDWQLSVCNAGEVAPAVRERLFEPFASGHTRGIGLGLAIVRQVCAANDWVIELTSGEGETRFTITAPGA
ncbi:MAG: histidine kinase dimerization/phospho-acceptor domain-containing protein, partial [Mariprofundaceae bacterium]